MAHGKKSHLRKSGSGFEKLKRLAAELKSSPHVKVGVLGRNDARPDGKIGNVELAIIHEFGAGKVPERSFLRSTADAKKAEWIALIRKIMKAVLAEKLPVEKGLGILGEKAVSDVRARIREGAGIPPPNAPSTVKAKGSSRPLVDTGRLVQSISYEVVRGGEK
jgi:phage gpG-like protein